MELATRARVSLGVVLLVLVNIWSCRGRDCEWIDYYSLKAIWQEDILCTSLTESDKPKCEELQQAYYGNSAAINLQQNLNYALGSKDNWTMLMVASHQGLPKLVKELLDNGAKAGINMQDKCGWSALMFATFTGANIKVVKLLLEHGASINQVNTHSKAALFMASGKGHVEIVKLLLQNGATTRHIDIHRKSAIAVGVYHLPLNKCQPDVVRAFLYNCDNDMEDLNGALWAAAYDYCCPEIVDDLIRFGAPTLDVKRILELHDPQCKDCEK